MDLFSKTLVGSCVLVILIAGCQKNNNKPTTPPNATDTLTSGTTPNAPAVIDSAMVLYVGRSNDLYAVNAQNGSVEWSIDLGDEVDQSPLYYQGMVYVETGAFYDCVLHAVDTTGKQQWSLHLSASIDPCDVLASNGLIYASTSTTSPIAVDAKTGSVRWTFSYPGLYPGIGGGAISLNQGVLYFMNGGFLFAIDPATGQRIGELDSKTLILPASSSTSLYLGGNDGYDLAYNRQDTTLKWQERALLDGIGQATFSSIYTAFGSVYAFENAEVDVLDTSTGKRKFTINTAVANPGPISLTDSLLFTTSVFGIACYNALTGNILWTAGESNDANTGYSYSAVTCVNGMVFFNSYYLFARSATDGKVIWRTLLTNASGQSWSTPCVLTKGGKIYRSWNSLL